MSSDLEVIAKLSRRLGSLIAVADEAIKHLQGRPSLSKEVLIGGLERAIKHDGSENYCLFSELDQVRQ
jgi:hypothetical protein